VTGLPDLDAAPSPLVALRRALHRLPELAWKEEQTARCLEAALQGIGLNPRRIAGTGLVVELPGPAGVPAVALRADTDALPVHEETGLAFSSIHPGVMHACGHDGHSAMLFGAAILLRDRPRPAPIRLLWQPAEEQGGGAEALIAAGALEGVGFIFGGHIDARYPTGTLVVSEGAVNASTDTFRLTLHGRGAHAARPHEGTDTIVAAAAIITALQTLVSREIAPGEPGVVTIGRLHAGEAPNVIAGKAVLEGTLRALHPRTRARLKEGLDRVSRAVAEAHGARAELESLGSSPAVINAHGPTLLAREAAAEVVGAHRVVPLSGPNLGGEDFAAYLDHVPGAFIRFGAGAPDRAPEPAHSSRFDFDEGALPVGAAWLARVAELAGERLHRDARP
jgi:amidohydrolase